MCKCDLIEKLKSFGDEGAIFVEIDGLLFPITDVVQEEEFFCIEIGDIDVVV